MNRFSLQITRFVTTAQSKASKCAYTRARKSLRYPLYFQKLKLKPLYFQKLNLKPLYFQKLNLKPLILCRSLSDSFVSKPHDMEEMVGLGTKLSSCPYYASRSIFNPTITTLNP